MGCLSSKDAVEQPADLRPTGAGSVIVRADGSAATGGGTGGASGGSSRSGSTGLGADAGAAGGAGATAGAALDGSVVVSKGGSYIIGSKTAGDWEPGAPILRPDNTIEAHHIYIRASDTTVIRLSYACYSEQGRSPKPPNKANQDSFCVMEALGNNPDVALFAVFDGHGPRGEDAANYCRINLPDQIVRSPAFTRNPFDALRSSFEATHRKFIGPETQRAGVDTSVSGTTAIAIMVNGSSFTCANVGDSRAMMGSMTPRGALLAKPLSIDHKPNRQEERNRIMTSSAKVLSERQLGIEGGDPDKYYVCRVYNGTIRYGVLFTRSLGDADAHANLGLLATPEMRPGKLTPSDRFFVLASDGVWDFLGEEDVARLVEDAGDDAQSAVLNVVQTAKGEWDRESERRRDDITAVVILIKHLTTAEADAEQKMMLDRRAAEADVEVDVSAGGGGGGGAAAAGGAAAGAPALERAVEMVAMPAAGGAGNPAAVEAALAKASAPAPAPGLEPTDPAPVSAGELPAAASAPAVAAAAITAPAAGDEATAGVDAAPPASVVATADTVTSPEAAAAPVAMQPASTATAVSDAPASVPATDGGAGAAEAASV